MTHWSRRARWIVAAAGLIFAVVVFVGIRQREKPARSIPIAPADPRADVEVTGATSRQWSGANENFTVKAERQFLYRDGGVKLQGVTVYVDDRQGNRKFVVTGREGEAGPDQKYVNLKDEVKLVSSDGLTVETPEASYSTGEGIIRAPGQVTFSRGRLSGRGLGMTYDRSRDVLWLLDQAMMTVAPDEHGASKLEINAGTIGLARQDKYVRIERDVRIVRDNREIRSDNAVGYLSEDESHLTSLDLRGNAHIVTQATTASAAPGTVAPKAPNAAPALATPSPAPPGAVEDMRARDISLAFGTDGERIERAVLTGRASIRLAAEQRNRGPRISGESLVVALNPDGTTATSLSARDQVQLEFPADGKTPARTVRAAMLDSTSDEKGELKGARLTEGVEYREVVDSPSTQPGHANAGAALGAPPVARIVRSRVLNLTFTPGMGGITDARFSGAVRFDQGDLRGTAATARYEPDRGVVELLGDENATPTVSDARIMVDARRILLTAEGPKVAATDAVRSVLRPDTRTSTAADSADEVKLPGFLTEDQPVNVTADALDYDGVLSRAVYTGSARLWQKESAVQGDSLTIDTKAGNLKATGSVRSTWGVEQTDEKTNQKRTVTNVASAHDLEYDDRTRRATYTTDAHLNGPQGDLAARKIELYLGKASDELLRLEGYEAVTWRESGRSATGDRLSYVSGEQRYELNGRPVRVVEECRESTGRTVTCYKSTDRIFVDGQQVSRTRTKNGNDCPR
jgi:LPS export ABC transporter protein LptC